MNKEPTPPEGPPRARAGLLIATVTGALVSVVALAAGSDGAMMFGVFLFLGGGFVYLATAPAKAPPKGE